MRRWVVEHPAEFRAKWQRNNERRKGTVEHKAREAVAAAVKSGKIVKPPCCDDCSKPTSDLEAHHEDYSRPLAVDWLCIPCHNRRHHPL